MYSVAAVHGGTIPGTYEGAWSPFIDDQESLYHPTAMPYSDAMDEFNVNDIDSDPGSREQMSFSIKIETISQTDSTNICRHST